MGVCCQGCLCAPKLFGKNANRIDGSNQCLMCTAYSFMPYCSACFLHLPRRRAIRAAFNLEEHPNDILVICCCDPCANCQEKREMDLRGTYIVLALLFKYVSSFFSTRRSRYACSYHQTTSIRHTMIHSNKKRQ